MTKSKEPEAAPLPPEPNGHESAEEKAKQERVLKIIDKAYIDKAYKAQPKPKNSSVNNQRAHTKLSNQNNSLPPSTGKPFTSYASIPMEQIEWVLQDWIATKNLTLIVGPTNVGKSLLAWTIAARVSQKWKRGLPSWPDERPTESGDVLICSTEEKVGDKIKPKFLAAGGDEHHVHKINGIPEQHPTIPDYTRQFTYSDQDMEFLYQKAKCLNKGKGVKLIILDPITQVVESGASENSKARVAYQKLTKLAERLNCAIVGIAHPTRHSKGKEPRDRIAGVRSLQEVARSVMMVESIRLGPTELGEERLLVLTKYPDKPTNYGLTFSIETNYVTELMLRTQTLKIACFLEKYIGKSRVFHGWSRAPGIYADSLYI